jgi:hypothetical protein
MDGGIRQGTKPAANDGPNNKGAEMRRFKLGLLVGVGAMALSLFAAAGAEANDQSREISFTTNDGRTCDVWDRMHDSGTPDLYQTLRYYGSVGCGDGNANVDLRYSAVSLTVFEHTAGLMAREHGTASCAEPYPWATNCYTDSSSSALRLGWTYELQAHFEIVFPYLGLVGGSPFYETVSSPPSGCAMSRLPDGDYRSACDTVISMVE